MICKLDEKIAIWGYGREGHATLKFVLDQNPKADLTIINDGPIADAPAGMPVLIGEAGVTAIASGAFATVIKSPGISLYRPEISAGKSNGTEFTSATNLWFQTWPDALTIGITGTKGKSTTASVLHFLFGLAGKRSKLLGNVGTPMLSQSPGEDVTVLELSSYQIADMNHFPKLAMVTNLHPEHGPWHHGHENYFRDKMRLVTANPSVPVALNTNDERVATIVKDRANITYFENAPGFHVDGDGICDGAKRLDIRNLALRGRHNLVNVAGAFTLLKMAGAYTANRVWDFANFKPLPHRLQELRLTNGVLAVNDSISTIPETTRAALDVHGHAPFHLILGGVDRGQDFNALRTSKLCLLCAASICPTAATRIIRARGNNWNAMFWRLVCHWQDDLKPLMRRSELCLKLRLKATRFCFRPALPVKPNFLILKSAGQGF